MNKFIRFGLMFFLIILLPACASQPGPAFDLEKNKAAQTDDDLNENYFDWDIDYDYKENEDDEDLTISYQPIILISDSDEDSEKILSVSDDEYFEEDNYESKTELYYVARVIDGDTIELANGQRVRYIGIDTPETVHPDKPAQCFGQEASNKNKELVAGKRVRLEKDVSETDKYGRLLRYVYVGDVFVNLELVSQGYAYAFTYPPDVKYADVFVAAQKEARENNRGLWGVCK